MIELWILRFLIVFTGIPAIVQRDGDLCQTTGILLLFYLLLLHERDGHKKDSKETDILEDK